MSGLVSGLVGIQTMAAQPAVLAFNSASDANATGSGGTVTVDFDTEIFDQNSDFASDTFTAPVDGRYLILTTITTGDITADTTQVELVCKATQRSPHFQRDTVVLVTGTRYQYRGSILMDMDANDNVYITLAMYGQGSDLIDILGGTVETYMSVIKVA